MSTIFCFFFQAEDGIRDLTVTGVQTCALPILGKSAGTECHPDCQEFEAWQANDVSSGPSQDLGRAARKMGEGETSGIDWSRCEMGSRMRLVDFALHLSHRYRHSSPTRRPRSS